MGKLVRDKLEDPIKSIHMQATFKSIKDNELEGALKSKLKEEMDEFLEATSLQNKTEEVADILEVLECILTLSSLS